MSRVTTIFIMILGLLVISSLGGWRIAAREQSAAVATVQAFGQKLGGPESAYAPLVTPELLRHWENNPSENPRQLATGLPSTQINIASIVRAPDQSYNVLASILAPVGSYPILLKLKKVNNRWLISDVVTN